MTMYFACISCGTDFVRYNTIQRRCLKCSLERQAAKPTKASKPLQRSQKPIKQQGKAHTQWVLFRDKVARPYLDNKYGIQCSDCGIYPPKKEDGTYYRHDVDHIQNKGSHPELKFEPSNLTYRCRNCHIGKTGVPQWTKKTPA